MKESAPNKVTYLKLCLSKKDMVVTSLNGSTYHDEETSCGTKISVEIEMSKEEAEERGFRPCKHCFKDD